MLQVHQIPFRLKKGKRIGRGGKRGTYSGRGMKGQKARAGRRIKPMVRELILRLPKLRGTGNLRPKERVVFEVNLDQIDKVYQEGEKVSLQSLEQKKLLRIPKSIKRYQVKILGRGQLRKKLIFTADLAFSERARSKIIAHGSSIE